MKLVIIESPFFNKNPKQQEYNVLYARECMKECLYNNEAPYLSHLLYTQILDDNILEERNFGIEAGFEFRKAIHTTIVYTDLGISSGMAWGIENAIKMGNTVEYRNLKNFEDFKEKNKELLQTNIVNVVLHTPDINTFKNSNQSVVKTIKRALEKKEINFNTLNPKMGFLTDEQKVAILTRSTLNKNTCDDTIELICNRLFGNPEYDSFMKLQPEHIQEIKDFLAQVEIIKIRNELLRIKEESNKEINDKIKEIDESLKLALMFLNPITITLN